MYNKAVFRLGERKYVDIRVESCDERPFMIKNAKYVLKNGEQVETSGECQVQQENTSAVISALIQPKIKDGRYTLEFTYEVPPEILMYNVLVNVI